MSLVSIAETKIFKGTSLELLVEPAQVRLITTSDDQYCWKVLPGKEHLFEKQMSKHSIGAYMELFREVGVSFEAVLATSETTKQDRGSDNTFSRKIEQLESNKQSLIEELCLCKSRVERAEKEIDQLRTTVYRLKTQDAQKIDLINEYRNITVRSLKDANSAFEKFRLSAVAREWDDRWSSLDTCSYSTEEERMHLD
jgi:hypothetical protein